MQTIERHSSTISTASFSRNEKLLTSASRDHTIRIWNVASETFQLIIENDGDFLIFSPDDKQLLSTSDDNQTIRLWNIISEALQKSFDYFINIFNYHTTHASSIMFFSWYLTATVAIRATSNSIQIWGIVSRNLQMTLEGHSHIGLITFSPDGTQLASASISDHTLKLWNLATGSLKHDLQGTKARASSIAFSPNSLLLASSLNSPIDKMESVGKIELWSTATGDLQWTTESHSHQISSLAFSPDGKRLVSGSLDSIVQLWDTDSGALHQTLKSHSNSVTLVVFSPDGHLLTSTSCDGTIKLWKVFSGIQTLQQNFKHLSNSVIASVILSPDGKRLISASKNDELKLWDAFSETQQHELGKYDQFWGRPAIFLPNSRQFLTYLWMPNEIKLWEASSGTLQHTMKVHVSEIFSLVFSGSGKLLALGERGPTAKIELWEIATGTLQYTFNSRCQCHLWPFPLVAKYSQCQMGNSSRYERFLQELQNWPSKPVAR